MADANGKKPENEQEEKAQPGGINPEQAPTETEPKATVEAEASVSEASSNEPSHPWEAELDEYPLRPPEEDANWAIRTVQTWLGFALFSLAFVLVMLILGFFYD